MMNGFGEPNMGNPSVRFDEGRERVVIGCAFHSNSSAYSTERSPGLSFPQKIAKAAKAMSDNAGGRQVRGLVVG